jgi:hypothetical protein
MPESFVRVRVWRVVSPPTLCGIPSVISRPPRAVARAPGALERGRNGEASRDSGTTRGASRSETRTSEALESVRRSTCGTNDARASRRRGSLVTSPRRGIARPQPQIVYRRRSFQGLRLITGPTRRRPLLVTRISMRWRLPATSNQAPSLGSVHMRVTVAGPWVKPYSVIIFVQIK